MDYNYVNRKEEIIKYFDDFAKKRKNYRKKRSYYWDSITRHCDYFINKNLTVLEVGCGSGELIGKINAKEKMGIDFSSKMIEQAKVQFPEVEFKIMDAENLQIDKKFDVIILSNVIGYLDDIEHVFNELSKVCHSRTKIIISYYNYLWEPLISFAEFIRIKRQSPQQSWLSSKDIVNLLYLAGFEEYRHARKMLFPFKVPLLSFFLNKVLGILPLFNSLCLNQYSFARKMPDEVNSNQEYTTSVVIPARNESGNIENAILRLPKFGKHIEIIFVEGNSTDDTWEKIQAIQEKYKDTHDIKIMQQDGKGKGDAVRKAYNTAKGDILMILDADLTVPPETLPKFYSALASGKGEYINGCRLIYPLEKNSMRFLNTLGNKFFSLAFSWVLEQPIKDTLCGTKVMFREDYLKLVQNRGFFGNFDPFGDFDLIFGAYKLNLKMIDLPIRYQERVYGDTNISRFSHGFLLLRMWLFSILKIKLN